MAKISPLPFLWKSKRITLFQPVHELQLNSTQIALNECKHIKYYSPPCTSPVHWTTELSLPVHPHSTELQNSPSLYIPCPLNYRTLPPCSPPSTGLPTKCGSPPSCLLSEQVKNTVMELQDRGVNLNFCISHTLTILILTLIQDSCKLIVRIMMSTFQSVMFQCSQGIYFLHFLWKRTSKLVHIVNGVFFLPFSLPDECCLLTKKVN